MIDDLRNMKQHGNNDGGKNSGKKIEIFRNYFTLSLHENTYHLLKKNNRRQLI